jgi:UDP-N-acetylglucosamine 1-carboxyvinyltransferase
LGCTAEQLDNDVYIDSSALSQSTIPHTLMEEMRSSVIFMGALLSRCGSARLSLPGGCQLGKRPIDLHLAALRQMGAEIQEEGGEISCHAESLCGADIDLPFPSVGATENIMLAASNAKGRTVIHGAAREPEIVALQEYLKALGMDISGAGTDTVVISGFAPKPTVAYRIIPDRIVASTIACAAAATGGNVEMRGVAPQHFSTVLHFLNAAGCDIMSNKRTVRIAAPERLKAVGEVSTQPYPGFPTDAQPVLMAALLRAEGRTVITENIFENRYRHVPELQRLGADISVTGRRAELWGVDCLQGSTMTATDLRGGAAMIVAALSAEGESTVLDNGHVTRGYERLDVRLRSLGAEIYLE